MQKFRETALTIRNGQVRVLPGASVSVYLADTNTLAELYANRAGTIDLRNPFEATDAGVVEFHAADGLYDVVIEKSGFDTVRLAGVSLLEGVLSAGELTAARFGNEAAVPYAAGLLMERETQTVEYLGVVYQPKPADLDFVTSGTFESAKFQQVRGITAEGMALPSAAQGVGVDDGSGGTLFTKLQGFLAYLKTGLGSAIVGFIQGGVNAVAQTILSKLRRVQLDLMDFGGVADWDGTSGTDNATAIARMVTYAKTLKRPKVVIPPGNFYTSERAIFDLPDGSFLDMQGDLQAPNGIQIGSTSRNSFFLRAAGVSVNRKTYDIVGTSVGAELLSLTWCDIDVRAVTGFREGLVCHGVSTNGGFSYNEIHLGQLHDNTFNMVCKASGSGYCNENNYYGGSLNHSSAYLAAAVTAGYTDPTINLKIAHHAFSNLNNNRFWGPSFEDNKANAVACEINGVHNQIHRPRLENPANLTGYKILFTANSLECEVICGYQGLVGMIDDQGLDNSYKTRSGWTMKAQSGTGDTEGVLRLQSRVSNGSVGINLFDPSFTSRLRMYVDGRTWSNSYGYYQTGIRWSTGSGNLNERGLFEGNGSPITYNQAAQPGSVYFNRQSADHTPWCKPVGTTAAEWVPMLALYGEFTAANIASVGHAINTTNKFKNKIVLDTTNNRLMRASGSAAADPWHVVDGSVSVTPT